MYSFKPNLCPHEISQLGGIDEINDNHELPRGPTKKKKNINNYRKQLKLKDKVGMAVPKFVGITYPTHYTSLCLLFE